MYSRAECVDSENRCNIHLSRLSKSSVELPLLSATPTEHQPEAAKPGSLWSSGITLPVHFALRAAFRTYAAPAFVCSSAVPGCVSQCVSLSAVRCSAVASVQLRLEFSVPESFAAVSLQSLRLSPQFSLSLILDPHLYSRTSFCAGTATVASPNIVRRPRAGSGSAGQLIVVPEHRGRPASVRCRSSHRSISNNPRLRSRFLDHCCSSDLRRSPPLHYEYISRPVLWLAIIAAKCSRAHLSPSQ